MLQWSCVCTVSQNWTRSQSNLRNWINVLIRERVLSHTLLAKNNSHSSTLREQQKYPKISSLKIQSNDGQFFDSSFVRLSEIKCWPAAASFWKSKVWECAPAIIVENRTLSSTTKHNNKEETFRKMMRLELSQNPFVFGTLLMNFWLIIITAFNLAVRVCRRTSVYQS